MTDIFIAWVSSEQRVLKNLVACFLANEKYFLPGAEASASYHYKKGCLGFLSKGMDGVISHSEAMYIIVSCAWDFHSCLNMSGVLLLLIRRELKVYYHDVEDSSPSPSPSSSREKKVDCEFQLIYAFKATFWFKC